MNQEAMVAIATPTKNNDRPLNLNTTLAASIAYRHQLSVALIGKCREHSDPAHRPILAHRAGLAGEQVIIVKAPVGGPRASAQLVSSRESRAEGFLERGLLRRPREKPSKRGSQKESPSKYPNDGRHTPNG